MAQGYLSPDQRRSQIKQRRGDNMEDRGEIYFQNLAMRCFFQDFEYDDRRRISACKMHDMIHDLAQIVAGDECHSVQVNGPVESIFGSLPSKVRHLSLDCSNSTSYFESFDGAKKLRSLLIQDPFRLTRNELSRLFSTSTYVRSLILNGRYISEIPSSIRKLVQLRWLHLSDNQHLNQLPETLCELHSLQTINVTQCSRSMQLPHGIGKLNNLRHLHNFDGPNRLPEGIAELTGLRTLEDVDVGCDDDEDGFSLGDLKNLNQLRGKLRISGLGACDRHVGEAKQAELKKKEHITQLDLCFSSFGGDEEHHQQLLEALEPSPNLETLFIYYYRGTTFPGWMISLMNLRYICLIYCNRCEHVPSLGKLPSLETLELRWMGGVKKVGVEVLGIEEIQIGERTNEISALTLSSSSVSSPPVSSSWSVSSPPVVIAFPKLTTLKFGCLHSWEEWDDYYDDTTKPLPTIQIMPSLRSLKIECCPQLKALPDYILQNTKQFNTLEIKNCHFLEERYNKERKDWAKISQSLVSHSI